MTMSWQQIGNQRAMGFMRTLVLVACGASTLTACGKSIDVAEWTEEVKLHDGRMVTVWRKARAYSGGFPNSKRGRDIDFELKFVPMNVYWQGTLSGDWIRDPISFEIFDGVPHLVLYVGNKSFCRDRPPTEYLAQFLRWSNGQWVEVKQTEFPIDKALMNIYRGYWGHTAKDDPKGLVAWDHKAMEDGFNADRPHTIRAYFERGQHFCKLYQ